MNAERTSPGVWVGGLIVVASVGLAAFLLGRASDDAEPASGPDVVAGTESSAEETSESPTPTQEADPEDPFSYVGSGGDEPSLSQTCSGVLGFCLGNPVEVATMRLGVENSRYEGATKGSIVRQWALDGFFLTIDADRVGSMRSLTVAMQEDATDLRISLPERILLGEVRMGDVKRRLGSPYDTDVAAGENVWIHSYIYRLGPEGTHVHEFSHSRVGEDVGFGAELDRSKVTSFSVHLPN